MTDNIKQLSTYLKIPPQRTTEFWNYWRINHIRNLSQNGKSDGEIFTPPEYRTSRKLDLLSIRKGERETKDSPDTTAEFPGGISVSIPIYMGDMSFGALSGTPNIAIAKAADSMNIVAGTGEGGLLPEIESVKNITVQWASARFGVTAEKLRRGIGIVIKVGQGAKPGIGGHLPGNKVTREISEARRIPTGVDAISPAPHHDIYSIEDLGRRIKMLKILTGKPVFVKVAATNYISFIASGIARMGGAGIIIDGYGAGTGAAPVVVRDNLGMPIEIAVESAHRTLVEEGLRDGFKIIAGGRVSTPEDMVKLICLGADFVTLGTAALIAMGCLMVHKCHQGSCPALLTNRLSDKRPPMAMDFALKSLENLISGWVDETKTLLSYMGENSLEGIRGRTGLLMPAENTNNNQSSVKELPLCSLRAENQTKARGKDSLEERVASLSGLRGNRSAHLLISSMGSTSDPSIKGPGRLLDNLIIDGAQVTRPSLDPHREPIDTAWVPMATFKSAIPAYIKLSFGSDRNNILRDASEAMSTPVLWQDEIELGGVASEVASFPSTRNLEWKVSNLIDEGTHFIEVDESLYGSDVPLEVSVSTLDTELRRTGRRGLVQIMASPENMRGSEDIAKLMCLGANAVSITSLAELALRGGATEPNIENLISGVKRELKLLSGAAGIGLLSNSFTGNRELLRAVSMDQNTLENLDVKEASS